MTDIEKAIKHCQGVIAFHTSIATSTVSEKTREKHIKLVEFEKTKLEALEIQKEKKPIDKCADNENWSIMTCPKCKRIFWNSGNSLRYEPEWCEKCGQRILWERPDWSEEE